MVARGHIGMLVEPLGVHCLRIYNPTKVKSSAELQAVELIVLTYKLSATQ